MTETIIVALISCLGTVLGSMLGILTSAKLTNYRIQQLEEKVDKHNGFAEKIPLIEEKIKVVNHRLDKLERTEHEN